MLHARPLPRACLPACLPARPLPAPRPALPCPALPAVGWLAAAAEAGLLPAVRANAAGLGDRQITIYQ